jgi:hypothetical protein
LWAATALNNLTSAHQGLPFPPPLRELSILEENGVHHSWMNSSVLPSLTCQWLDAHERSRLHQAIRGQKGSEPVVELLAETLGVVGRATEDGSLGWKLLRECVAGDAKGASGNLAG